jgi:hypothetical protein
LEVEAVQDLFRRLAESPLQKLWIDQQLRRHQLDPALVWKAVGLPAAPTTSGLRKVTVSSPPRSTEGGAV